MAACESPGAPSTLRHGAYSLRVQRWPLKGKVTAYAEVLQGRRPVALREPALTDLVSMELASTSSSQRLLRVLHVRHLLLLHAAASPALARQRRCPRAVSCGSVLLLLAARATHYSAKRAVAVRQCRRRTAQVPPVVRILSCSMASTAPWAAPCVRQLARTSQAAARWHDGRKGNDPNSIRPPQQCHCFAVDVL